MKRIKKRGPGVIGPGVRARDRSPGLGRKSDFTGIASAAAVFLFVLMLLSAIAGSALASVEKGDGGTKFKYQDPEAGAVFLSGSFNGWNATANPMKKTSIGDVGHHGRAGTGNT